MGKIYLEDMVVRFSQGPDCCQKDDETQIIEIHSEDNGVGTFFWLKTDRWSFSEPDDLVKLAERVRAMEETNNKYENGEVIYNNSIDNKSVNNKIKQAEYVDLGLPSGLKWAKCNVGAEKETDYGDYFMWGSTTPNTADECILVNAPFNNGSSSYDYEYFNAHKSEWLDNKNNLKAEFDAAYQATGGKSRMPTSDEFQELYDNTVNEWVENFNGSGVNGWKFISKTDTTKYIFFPACGNAFGVGVNHRGSGGDYWSSSLNPFRTSNSLSLNFFMDGIYPQDDYCRYCGFCVRPVIGQDSTKSKQYEYVDLGLPSGLKWAKCNIGAEKETDYGDYFMWGSTNPNTSDECTWANTPFNGGYSEYNADAFNQVKDTAYPNGILAKEYDTASQIMGGDWRMPTKDEIQELINNTDKEWTQVNGVNGRKFTSKTDESKYIFIPAAGYYGDGLVYGVGYGGNVWSSSLVTSTPGNVWDLDFGSVYCYMNFDNRCYGQSVRGVME